MCDRTSTVIICWNPCTRTYLYSIIIVLYCCAVLLCCEREQTLAKYEKLPYIALFFTSTRVSTTRVFTLSRCLRRGGAGKARPSHLATTPIVSGSVSKPSNRSPRTDTVHVQRASALPSVPIRVSTLTVRSAGTLESLFT